MKVFEHVSGISKVGVDVLEEGTIELTTEYLENATEIEMQSGKIIRLVNVKNIKIDLLEPLDVKK
ncbi:hypothetical protein HNP86_001810 [Methanococcus maripaludis]|uniref:Uncharacterized protein n=1 Tax=Methanococcus maripaludis TaxID=39152 RepID=A0A7J9NWF6_METMI|nr:hypothetical protein [Methanococcus maripaludis]MBA2851651.1 hypothetical protein [Methanococcus maripaludis]